MDRYKETKIAGILGIIGNIFLLFIKAIIGFTIKSQSLIADSANSASDIFASIMTYIGNKIASEPKDDSHNYGHGKAEYIFSLFISISMIAVAVRILIGAIQSLITKDYLEFSWVAIIVCITTIIIKFLLFLYTNRLVKTFDNLLLKANRDDHRNDCIVTTCTLLSILVTLIGIKWLDGIVGIGISIWIAYTGFTIFIESYNVLMDKSLDDETRILIVKLVKKNHKVNSIDSLHTIPVGYQYIVVLTIGVDGTISTFDSHELADKIENEITSTIDKVYDTIVHIEPK